MSFFSWLASATGNRQSAIGSGLRKPRAGSRKPPRFRPQLEALEDRWMPSTLSVTTYADSGPGSLRAEIAAANSGDTIVFDPSLAGTTIGLTSGELIINKSLTIQGSEWISGNGTGISIGGPGGTSRVFEVDGAGTTVTLSGLTIIDGEGVYAAGPSHAGDGQGGAVLNYGLLTLSSCYVSNSFAGSLGGGIYNAGTVTVSNCTVSNNWAGYGGGFDSGNGGGIYNTGTLIVSGSTVSENVANGPNLYGGFTGINGNGGGIYNAGSMNVSNTTMEFNLAAFAGAGIFNAFGATGSLTGSLLRFNGYTPGFGGNGGPEYYGTYWEVGGGIYNDGTLTLSGSYVISNYASYEGGGIYNDYSGKLTILNSVITTNSPNNVYNLNTSPPPGTGGKQKKK
jgi:hypothetical protein